MYYFVCYTYLIHRHSLKMIGLSVRNIICLLTGYPVRTEKYLARSRMVRTERSEWLQDTCRATKRQCRATKMLKYLMISLVARHDLNE